MSYFPMFIELKDKPCLVVGGGAVALRKVEALLDFGAEIFVTAPVILPEIKEIKGVIYCEKYFEKEDIRNKELVIAATDDPKLNHQISKACRMANIPVNAVDQIEDCSFIFPAYVKEGKVVAAFSSSGLSPVTTQYLKDKMRPILTPFVGELAACLGEIRSTVRQCVKTEEERKKVYREILEYGLKKDMLPSEAEIADIMQKYRNS